VASVTKKQFCSLLRAMHKDEVKAFPEYTKLMQAGYNSEIPKSEIEKLGNNRFDEKRHRSIIAGIINRNCRGK
jgi:hypothetical protein